MEAPLVARLAQSGNVNQSPMSGRTAATAIPIAAASG
jgi:hypothetical protein